MCGIFCYVGKENAVKKVVNGLKKLEYRGYDSAGLAYVGKRNEINIIKEVGNVENLKNSAKNEFANLAIAHTRWATHGAVNKNNCHPHSSENFVIVHNGIIENYKELKKEIVEPTYSDTDSEIVSKLINKYYKKNKNNNDNIEDNILSSIKEASKKLTGSWAIAIICKDDPKSIYIMKNKSPLAVVQNNEEFYVSSDINAVQIKNKNEIYYCLLNDHNIVKISENKVNYYDQDLKLITLKQHKTKSQNKIEKSLYKHDMIKEINEIPSSIFETKKRIINSQFKKFVKKFDDFSSITIIGCGTAYHAGLYGKFVFEQMLNKSVSVELASEFRYKKQIPKKNELVFAISQSGETADTIAALEIAKQNGATTVVITNVSSSTITRISDYVFLTRAGQETAVAATKSYVCQVFVLYRLACSISKIRLDRGLHKKAEKCLKEFNVENIEKFYSSQKFFFIGRLCDSSTALEGALKLKEISYVQSEGYPAGELKHGPISLVDENSLVIAILTQSSIKEKTLNAINEVRARGAKVLIVTTFEDLESEGKVIKIPSCSEKIASMLAIIPIQLFAYHFSVFKGLNPDKPRNLAKSVTVE